jgi:hypothetical protein
MGYYEPAYLRAHHKQAVRLRLQRYSHPEIGKLLGMHPKAVCKLLNSRKARLLIQEFDQVLEAASRKRMHELYLGTKKRIEELKGQVREGDLDAAGIVLETIGSGKPLPPSLDVSWSKRPRRRRRWKRRAIEDVVAELMSQG